MLLISDTTEETVHNLVLYDFSKKVNDLNS